MIWLLLGFCLIDVAGSTCPMPTTIAHGSWIYTGLSQGDTVTYTCKIGYRITSGSKTRQCNNSTWSGSLPVCTDMDALFSFTCDFTGTIIAVNPDPSSLVWAKANNKDKVCVCTWSIDKRNLTITGCEKEKLIHLVFSPYQAGIPNLVNDKVKFYNITCLEITLAGINRNLTDKTWVRILYSTTHAPYQVPSIVVEGQVLGLGSGVVIITDTTTSTVTTAVTTTTSPGATTSAGVTTAAPTTTTSKPTIVVNQKLTWRIWVPEPYIVLAVNCTSYSGITTSGDQMELKLIETGCSLNLNLMTDFTYEYYPKRHVAIADIYGFRFPGTNELNIKCVMKGCPPLSTKCDYDCHRKRKRSEPASTESSDYKSDEQSAKQLLPPPLASNDSDTLPLPLEKVEASHVRLVRAYDDDLSDQSDLGVVWLNIWVDGPPTVGLEYYEYLMSLHSSSVVASSSVASLLLALWICLCLI